MEEKYFWSNVKIGEADECWPWTGAIGARGYGRLVMCGKDLSAHRVAFTLVKGDPGDLLVRHTCDNRPCCNPSHLLSGTQAQNIQDAMDRGRWVKPPLKAGEDSHRAVLTERDVHKIRRSTGTPAEIAARLGLSYGAVWGVRVGRTWRWLETPCEPT